ncbi:MAG: glycosyltransferase family 2 protein [Candidatus Bathyarchaeia archaeon]
MNWNLKDDTIACIESVLASSYPPDRVIVVDNGSSDGSVSAIINRFGKTIDLIANKENLGFAEGVNVGIRYALAHGAEWILLLNNDTIIAQDMIEQLMAATDFQANIGILAPAIFRYDQPDRIWRLGDWHPKWSPIPFKVPAWALKTRKTMLPVDYVTGCGMFIRREVFFAIGLFDPGYFMYYEDADFCRRAIKAGFSIACVPNAHMWHKVSGSTRRDVNLKYYWQTRSRVRFYRRHYALPAWFFLAMSILWRLLVFGLRGNRQAMKACAQGFYDGWRLDVNQPTKGDE